MELFFQLKKQKMIFDLVIESNDEYKQIDIIIPFQIYHY